MKRLATNALQIIAQSVLCVQQGDRDKPANAYSPLCCKDGIWRDRPGVTDLPNTLAHLRINISPAADDTGIRIGIPQGAMLEEWHIPRFDLKGFEHFGDGFERDTLFGKDYLWPRHEGSLDIEQFPLLTHMGSINVFWQGGLMVQESGDKRATDVGGAKLELDGETLYVPLQDRLDVKRLREKLGWAKETTC